MDSTRILGIGSIPCRIPLFYQELCPLSAPWSRQWVREAQLRSPMVRPWSFHLRSCTRCVVDPQPPPVQPAHSWAAERDIGCCCIRGFVRSGPDVLETGQALPLPILLPYTVSEL